MQRHLKKLLDGTSGALLLILVAAAPAHHLHAQTVQGEEAAQTQYFEIPRQPLTTALDTLSRESGLSFAYNSSELAGIPSPGVRGTYTTTAALLEILSGTGVVHSFIGTSSVALKLEEDQEAGSNPGTMTKEASGPLVVAPIMVRGELLERSVQDSQTSAVIISGEQLDQRGETQLDQILRRVPGAGPDLRIRGISADGQLAGNSSTTSTITVAADGIRFTDYRNTDRQEISTWDLEQVEVLRGSQSTQSGRNALAGTIRLESAKPEFIHEYRFRGGLLEDERDLGYQAAVALNTPFIEDKLAGRLSVDVRNTDGFAELSTIRAGLRFDPTDKLSLGLTYTDIDNDRGLNRQDDGFNRLELQSLNFTVDYDINDALSFSSRTQYTEAAPGFLQFGDFFGFTIEILRDREYDTLDQEFQLTYETDRMRAIAGVFYTNISETSLLDLTLVGISRDTTLEELETENYAPYGEVEYDLSKQWTLIAGLRFDTEEIETTNTVSRFSPDGSLIASARGTFDNTYDAPLPKLGAVYRLDDNRSLGLTYQRGYRGGGVFLGLDVAGNEQTLRFDPEFTDTVELAFRSQSTDGSRTFNANVFFTDYTDQQVSDQNSAGVFVTTNAGSSELWGAEIEYREFVTEGLEVSASAAYLNTEYVDLELAGEQLAGNEFPTSPELMAFLGATYTTRFGLSLGADANYTASTFSDGVNRPEFENDSYWLINLNADYVFRNGLVLTAYARNLLDEEYTLGQSMTGVSFGPARQYGLLVSFDLP